MYKPSTDVVLKYQVGSVVPDCAPQIFLYLDEFWHMSISPAEVGCTDIADMAAGLVEFESDPAGGEGLQEKYKALVTDYNLYLAGLQ